MILVLLQSEWPWQPNDTNTFFYLSLCFSVPGVFLRKKHYRLVLFYARALQSFYFLCFLSWCMQALQRFLCIWTPLMKGPARNVWRLNTQTSQEGTFVHYPFFVLNIPLFTLFSFSYRNFFPLFICFDILWRLVTTHATGTQIVRAKWRHLMRFFAGKTSRALAFSLVVAAENTKNLPLAKNLSSTCCQA